MAAYERNTGKSHPLAGGIKTSSKRATGNVPLTDYNAELWFGSLSVGTPPEKFTSMTLFSPVKNGLLTMSRMQWTLTPGAVISSCPQRNAARPVQGTKSMTHFLALPRSI
jgi:hypothetical protein